MKKIIFLLCCLVLLVGCDESEVKEFKSMTDSLFTKTNPTSAGKAQIDGTEQEKDDAPPMAKLLKKKASEFRHFNLKDL